jgi:hypothetical protein
MSHRQSPIPKLRPGQRGQDHRAVVNMYITLSYSCIILLLYIIWGASVMAFEIGYLTE